MKPLLDLLRRHRHFVIIVPVLTLVTTFPTIIYLFRTDVFWLPSGLSGDALTEIWDVWYGGLVLSGQADRFYADRIFFPRGVSIVYHPFNLPYVLVVNALQSIMPVSNAFSLAYLLIIIVSTAAAYFYLRWLMKDKWIALFGAVVFGFSPHVVGHPNHPNNALIATVPLLFYCFHRGVLERRRNRIIAAGLLTGLTSVINIYAYVCSALSLGLMAMAFAISRWRSKRFWLLCALLLATIAISSVWRIYPMIASSQALDAALGWRGVVDNRNDVVSFFVNHRNPVTGPAAHDLLNTVLTPAFSQTGYLGYLPLILIGIGLFSRATRSRMLPWLALCSIFLVLRLGMALSVNGVRQPEILLPQYFLSEILPSVFRPFFETDNYHIGALLPLAVSASYGLVALRRFLPIAARPAFIILLIALLAAEYYIPVKGWQFPNEQFVFLDQFAGEGAEADIRVINVPMGRSNAKLYNLYQALSGITSAEGAVSRTPDSAFDYIRGNFLLNFWLEGRSAHCQVADSELYLSAVAQLEEDGFSHVALHRRAFKHYPGVRESFRGIEPLYSDDYAAIYAVGDLRQTCGGEPEARHRYTAAIADALLRGERWHERQGLRVVMPPTAEAGEHFSWYLRHFTDIEAPFVMLTGDEPADITFERLDATEIDAAADLERRNAVWLVDDSHEFKAEDRPAYQDWFAPRFRFCRRFHEGELGRIDIYLKRAIPCAAVGEGSAIEARYKSGLRLHNFSYAINADTIRVYLAWTNQTGRDFGFSLQFFDEAGNKALQYDNVVFRDFVTTLDLDAASLASGEYALRLIVYDYETRKSEGGTLTSTGERFTRELEVARIQI